MAIFFFMMIFIVALFLLLHARLRVERKQMWVVDEKQIAEYAQVLRQRRVVGDFVLTGAAVPAMTNDIRPVEGFRIYDHQGFFQINGGSIIVASVSAEKMKGLMQSFAELLGETASISFTDHNADQRHIIDYIAYDRDVYVVQNLLDNYWRMIANNAEIVLALFSTEYKVEIVLSQIKMIHLHVVDMAPFIHTLQEYGVFEKRYMRFFYEGEHHLFSDLERGEFFQMVNSLGYDERRFYERQES